MKARRMSLFDTNTDIRHFELGKQLVEKSFYREAYDHFNQCIRENEGNAFDILTFLYKRKTKQSIDINIMIAKIYMSIHMMNEGFDCLEESLKHNLSNEQLYDELAKLLTETQLRQKIKQLFEFAFNQAIYFPSIISVLSTFYIDEKNYSKSIDFYQTLIKTFPDQLSYYKILSELFFRKRDYESASKAIETLIQLAPYKSEELRQPIEQIIQKIPRHKTIRILYATILFKANKPEEACKELETLLTYHPIYQDVIDLLHKHKQSFPDHPTILFFLAQLLVQVKAYAESIGYIQSIYSTYPQYSDKCLALMQEIIQAFPHHPLALEVIGRIYMQQQNFHQAIHYFDLCVSHHPQPACLDIVDHVTSIANDTHEPCQNQAKLLIAKLLVHLKKNDDALAVIETLLSTEEALKANLLRIKILANTHAFSEALQIIHRLLKDYSNNGHVYATLRFVYDEFIRYSLNQTAISSTELSQESIIQRATLLMAQQNFTGAIEQLQTSHEQSISIDIQRLVGRCYFELSRYDLCKQVMTRIDALKPSNQALMACMYWSGLSELLLNHEQAAIQKFEQIQTIDCHYLNTEFLLDQLRKQTFFNHHGLVLLPSYPQFNERPSCMLKKNHFSHPRKKNHAFEVIGFAQSYNDDGCKQIIKQQFSAGRESLTLAIQMDPTFYISYVNLAIVCLLENNVHGVDEILAKAESVTTNCPYIYYAKALYFIKRQQADQAIRSLQQSLKLSPNECLFHITLGDIFFAQNQVEIGFNYWEKASAKMNYSHLLQQRYRMNHFDKLGLEYWISPEYLSIR